MLHDFVEIAKVGSTYKLDGDLNLYPLANSIENLLRYGAWYIKLPGSSSWQLLEDESVYKRADGKVYIKLAGIDDINAAKQYVNALIGVPKSVLPQLADDEVYFVDIIGCDVVNQKDESFGRVIDVIETGANEVLICKKDKSESLIPYVKQYILNEDIKNKKIVVDWEYDY